MTTTKPKEDLSNLNFVTHPNLSRMVERHLEEFPDQGGMVADALREGMKFLKDPPTTFHFSQTVDLFKGYCDRGFAALEERLERLEAKPTLRDAGVWRDTEQYQAGDVVSHGGSAWVARQVSIGQRPGYVGEFWRLMVKKGRDAKDAKQ